jgi:EAL domain-containing protein (putative c-di-GMP-specific phosphodiesterase class I)
VRTGARWAQMWSHPPTVAVNMSAMHFQQRDFVDQVRDTLRRYGMHPSQLELEITEGVVLGDNAEVKRNLDGLAMLGVRIALDDFGTGYSNIAYLSHLKPDRLKIDQTFIRRLGNNPHVRSLVAAIIGIGRAIDCEVVAEGVETAEQLAEIKALGCQLVQGYYFARPMPVGEFEQWREMSGFNDEASSIQQLRRVADRMAAVDAGGTEQICTEASRFI